MKQIPFYSDPDGTHSLAAVYQMLLDYYLNKRPHLNEVNTFVRNEPLSKLKRQGFDIQATQPSLAAIDELLREDYLLMLEQANGQTRLIIQREGEHYILHDPGLPKANRRVSPDMLRDMLGTAQKPSKITGFIFRKAYIAHRLDQYVIAQKPNLSRSFAAKLIAEGKVRVNGKTTRPGHRVQPGDKVSIDYDDTALNSLPQLDLPILYEDDDCVVINKPAGVLTHAQGKFILEATVATFLRSRLKADDLSGERAGIVHRLDRATSGVIICAKNQPALAWLQKQFADREAHKTYLAVIPGHLKQKEAVIDMPIERNPKAPATFRAGPNGKPATTRYVVLEESPAHSLVELKPRTGRTHQLRVHLQKLGHPIVGDPLYGTGSYGDRLYLHAYQLEITLPDGIKKIFTADIPDEFRAIMKG
jgi:23S rRNA pseudouridine1911/1915/1917 synthase